MERSRKTDPEKRPNPARRDAGGGALIVALRGAAVTLCLIAAATAPARGASSASLEKGFRAFLEADIWPAAKAAKVPRATFDEAFRGVHPNLTLPDLVLPGQSGRVEENTAQTEFRSPAGYFNEKKIAALALRGRALLAEHRAVLARVEARTGVPAPIIVAIWGRESGYGAAKLPYSAFEVLATEAYLSRRREMFRGELVAALRIVSDGHLTVSDMRSSSAGALGQPQFMPTKFLALAADFDGDGRRDIWTSVPDTLASIGNFLHEAGWVKGRGWGFEATAPASLSCASEGPDKGRLISSFVKDGVTRVSGRPFPKSELRATGNLLMPAGRLGPAFIATPNFYALKVYNNSDLYALFIGTVADRLSGGSVIEGAWPAAGSMTRGDVARMQEALSARGYDVGGADGLAGFKTRRSIGAYEKTAGLPETCWPTEGLAAKMK